MKTKPKIKHSLVNYDLRKILRDRILKKAYYHIRPKPFIQPMRWNGDRFRFYITSFHDFLYSTGCRGHEPSTQEWIETFFDPSDVFYDIGANIGLFSLYAGKKAGCSIYAFEPDKSVFNVLQQNVRLNNANVRCYNFAVDPANCVDKLVKTLPFPNHVKIDTEGAEPQILNGMKKTLSDNRLKSVLLECNYDDGFWEMLFDFGFEFFRASEGTEDNLIFIR